MGHPAFHPTAALPPPAGAARVTASAPPATRSDSKREGTRLGAVVATATWAWIAIVDAIAGQPFETFSLLGGIVLFTVVHYLLNIAYGRVIASTVRGAAGEPSLIFALIFGFLMVEIAFAMMTVLLSHLGLGELAWLRIFGGSVIGTVTGIILLSRTHPLRADLRRAEEET